MYIVWYIAKAHIEMPVKFVFSQSYSILKKIRCHDDTLVEMMIPKRHFKLSWPLVHTPEKQWAEFNLIIIIVSKIFWCLKIESVQRYEFCVDDFRTFDSRKCYAVVQFQNFYLPTPIETALQLFIYLPTYSYENIKPCAPFFCCIVLNFLDSLFCTF